ncbi:MAG TPA: glycoside hydrolase family 130 protein, partial [Ignavibacteriales bacterium]|nr:glycoside hydrolase family 130 protein [Ignavibacteriales bacterium]
KLAQEQRLLIGAYFTMEYSVEAAALFNPSIVWHPDQTKLPAGSKRFVVSLRSTGEGHISSITFRSGVIDSGNNIKLDEPTRYLCLPEAIEDHGHSDYTMTFANDTELSERILFPYAPAETNGVEDARFVQFTEDDGSVKYYATYTAYDGHSITPRILETTNFITFKVSSLKGSEVVNKGFALFPRKIKGKYAMLSRQDNENNFIMFSDDLYTWNSKKMIMEPEYPWDFIQLGNCGSPIETDAGWLVLSHGVGAMRKYSIGAFLLDKDNPERVIGRLKEPLISPNENEREGYVPNVVYSCGGLISRDELIIPYAMSDYASSFAKAGLKEIIKELLL